MQRVTVTIDDDLMAEIDDIVATRGYQNRSEAIRDLARSGIRQAAIDLGTARECVGALLYVYDHEARELSKRLTRTYHAHHDLSLATFHVHLDHDSCMEITVLRGPTEDVSTFSQKVIAERGVRHGQVMLLPVEVEEATHGHGAGHRRRHVHLHPHGGDRDG